MTALPTGTVTFLFTDVEGSTELITTIGKDAYATVIGDHHRLVEAAVADAAARSWTRRATRSSQHFPERRRPWHARHACSATSPRRHCTCGSASTPASPR